MAYVLVKLISLPNFSECASTQLNI